MIRFASNTVSPHGVQGEILLALWMVDPIFARYGSDTLVTSLTDGTHKPESLHYRGRAVDLRTKHLRVEDKTLILAELHAVLPPYYEIYLEDGGGDNEHLHIEYDWKGVS